jgi:hypothetical protein
MIVRCHSRVRWETHVEQKHPPYRSNLPDRKSAVLIPWHTDIFSFRNGGIYHLGLHRNPIIILSTASSVCNRLYRWSLMLSVSSYSWVQVGWVIGNAGLTRPGYLSAIDFRPKMVRPGVPQGAREESDLAVYEETFVDRRNWYGFAQLSSQLDPARQGPRSRTYDYPLSQVSNVWRHPQFDDADYPVVPSWYCMLWSAIVLLYQGRNADRTPLQRRPSGSKPLVVEIISHGSVQKLNLWAQFNMGCFRTTIRDFSTIRQ